MLLTSLDSAELSGAKLSFHGSPSPSLSLCLSLSSWQPLSVVSVFRVLFFFWFASMFPLVTDSLRRNHGPFVSNPICHEHHQ